jgi:uncharacterized protein (TIGR03083 family)
MDHPTRLTRTQYLEYWNDDLQRILSLSPGALSHVVPTCPQWTVHDLLDHLAGVYQHKSRVLELGKMPPPAWSEEAALERRSLDLLVELPRLAHVLQGELLARADDDEASTFMKSDRTVGFWWRRMALETAVHRTDVEVSVGPRTEIPEDLARDGIDELLWFATAPWQNGTREGWSGQHVVVDAGELAWTIILDPAVIVTTLGDDGSTTRVTGSADALLQWSAGRRVDDVVRVGDHRAIALVERFLGNF